MKKLIKQILVLSIVCVMLGLFNVVLAASPEGSIALSADRKDKTYAPGDTVIVTLSFPTFEYEDDYAVHLMATFNYSDKLTLTKMTTFDNWDKPDKNNHSLANGTFIFGSSDTPTTGEKVMNAIFTVNDDAEGTAEISLTDVKCESEVFPVTPVTITIAKTENPNDGDENQEQTPPDTEDDKNQEQTPPNTGDDKNQGNQDQDNQGGQQDKDKDKEDKDTTNKDDGKQKPSTNGSGTTGTTDSTTSPDELPQTGENYALWYGVIVCVIAVVMIAVFYKITKYIARRKM